MGEIQDPEGVEALYAEAPGRFIAARNELAAQLGSAGDLLAAKRVSSLRKPTVAAWAVDTLARDHPVDLEALIRAGTNLASAQRAMAAGGGADRLREVADERRRLVELLVRASGNALQNAGLSAARAVLDKVSDTLMAIATDQEAAERVRRGVLDKELPASAGFGDDRLDSALLASVSELPKRSNAGADGRSAARAERLAAQARTLREDADRLEREAKEAEANAVSAARSAAAARRRADAARRRVR